MYLNKLNGIFSILTLILSCTLIDDIGDQNNPFDPDGSNWTENQPPVLYDSIQANPPWVSFDFLSTTGSVIFAIYAVDPENELDMVSYSVLLSTDNTTFTPHTCTKGDSVLLVAGIVPATQYIYKVIAFDLDSINANDTAIGLFNSPGGIPPRAPENFTIENLSSAIHLKWSSDSAIPVILFRSDSLAGPYLPVDSVIDTSYYDTVTTYNLYYYRIATFNIYGNNYHPDTLTGRRVNASLTPPRDPAWYSSTLSASTITITFYTVDDSSYSVEGYEIFRGSKPSGPYQKIGDTTANIMYSFDYTDRNIPSTETYYYKYSYFTNVGNSPFSDTVSAHTIRLDAPAWVDASYGTSGTQIEVNWSSVPGALGYLLYRHINIFPFGDTVFLDSVSDTTYLDTPPTDTTYHYFLAAYSESGPGDFSTYYNSGSIMKIPFSVAIDTMNTSDTVITVSWESNVSSQSYITYRSTDSLSFIPYDTVATTSKYGWYFDSTVSPGNYTRYYYRVSQFNPVSNEQSYKSTIIGGTLKPVTFADTIRVTSYPDSVVLVWQSIPGALTYRLYRSLSPSAYYLSGFKYAFTTADTTYTVIDSIDTTFYYRVVGANTSGQNSWVNGYGVSATSLKTPVPGTVKATGTASHILVTLSDFTQTDGYLLYRSNDSLSGYTFLDSLTAHRYRGDTTCYMDSVLVADTLYYKALAYNQAGTSAFSLASNGAYRRKPDMTDSVHATDGTLIEPNSIQVTWYLVNGVDTYTLFRANKNSGSDGDYSPITTTTTFDTVYIDSVPSDTIYYYRVKATNVAGQGSMSSKREGGFRRPTVVPDTVISLSASKSYSDYIRVSWKKPATGANLNGFYVSRSTTSDSLGTYTVIDTLQAHETFLNDYGATMTSPNKTWYKVSIFNIIGEGPKAGPVDGWLQ